VIRPAFEQLAGPGQLLLGITASGMRMCPMTLPAKQLSAARFGLWSGAMLSSPLGLNAALRRQPQALDMGRRAAGE